MDCALWEWSGGCTDIPNWFALGIGIIIGIKDLKIVII